MTSISLTTLLNLPTDQLIQQLSGIYEHSAWIPEETFSSSDKVKSIQSLNALFQALKDTVEKADDAAKLKLLCEHPDLCARAGVKEMEMLTEESRVEQGRAGLSQLTSEEYDWFIQVCQEYREKFGFPFILAVRNATKHTVLAAIRVRVKNSAEVEFAAGLAQVHKIAWMRLVAMIDLPEENRGFLTCHVLDTASGTPASGMRIELFKISSTDDEKKEFIAQFCTNADGRIDGGPALKGAAFEVGVYEWIFYVHDYFSTKSSLHTCGNPFLNKVPIRFGIDDPEAHYHVPLLVSPFGFSTYRGS